MPNITQRAVSVPDLRILLIGGPGRKVVFHFRRNIFFLIAEAISCVTGGRLVGGGQTCRQGLITSQPAGPFPARSLSK